MILKKSIIAVLLNFLFLTTPVALAYAQTTRTITPGVIMYPLRTNTGSTSASLTNRENNLQTRAATEITRRITALNQLLTNVSKLKHVSSTQKATFTTQIQNEINSLNSLQTKIQGDTDITTLKTDVQSIVTSYRVFLVFMPQIRLLSAADSLLTVSDNLTNLGMKLQARLVAANSAGQNVKPLQSAYTDMQAKITDAQTQANAIITEVTPLTPTGYPGTQTTFQDARTKLMLGITDLKTAATDAKQIIQGLVTLGGTQSTASPSATTTTTTP